jgi:heme exporter protein CcmD
MFEFSGIMDAYSIYVWPSYCVTLFSLVYLFVRSIYKSKKAKEMLNQLRKEQ